jgi:hypothetical protein
VATISFHFLLNKIYNERIPPQSARAVNQYNSIVTKNGVIKNVGKINRTEVFLNFNPASVVDNQSPEQHMSEINVYLMRFIHVFGKYDS